MYVTPMLGTNNSSANVEMAVEATSKQFKKACGDRNKKLKASSSELDDAQMNHVYNILRQIAAKRLPPKDDITTFVEHLAAKLRKFDPLTRAHTEQKLFKLVSDVEVGILGANSNSNKQRGNSSLNRSFIGDDS